MKIEVMPPILPPVATGVRAIATDDFLHGPGGGSAAFSVPSLGLFGACLMIDCLGQGVKRVVGLHRVRADLSLLT